MADEVFSPATDPNGFAPANGEDTAPAVGLISQYVKDLSFENPNAPGIYQNQTAPAIDVQFNIGAAQVGEEVHEVSLKVEIRAEPDLPARAPGRRRHDSRRRLPAAAARADRLQPVVPPAEPGSAGKRSRRRPRLIADRRAARHERHPMRRRAS